MRKMLSRKLGAILTAIIVISIGTVATQPAQALVPSGATTVTWNNGQYVGNMVVPVVKYTATTWQFSSLPTITQTKTPSAMHQVILLYGLKCSNNKIYALGRSNTLLDTKTHMLPCPAGTVPAALVLTGKTAFVGVYRSDIALTPNTIWATPTPVVLSSSLRPYISITGGGTVGDNLFALSVKTNASNVQILTYQRSLNGFTIDNRPATAGVMNTTYPSAEVTAVHVRAVSADGLRTSAWSNVAMPGSAPLLYEAPRQSNANANATPGGTFYYNETKTEVGHCSVAFSWVSKAGQRLGVTADHCFGGWGKGDARTRLSELPDVYTQITNGKDMEDPQYLASIVTPIGKPLNRKLFQNTVTDMAVFTQVPPNRTISYGNHNYDPNGFLYSSADVHNSTIIPIIGTALPQIGTNVCVAGGRYGTDCGYKILRLTTTTPASGLFGTQTYWWAEKPGKCDYVDASGKHTNFRGGDSGGTVYLPSGTGFGGTGSQAKVLGTLTQNDEGKNIFGKPAACMIGFTDLQQLIKQYGGTIVTAK